MYGGKYQGKYKPTNPKKYKGDTNNICYRSSWELKYMIWCDNTESVLEWGSEIITIPYLSPVDNKVHRYFVDFYVRIVDKNKTIQNYLVEVKPERFTKPPTKLEKQTKQNKKFLQEVFQWGVNEAKWKAATAYCNNKGWKFVILTEKDLLT